MAEAEPTIPANPDRAPPGARRFGRAVLALALAGALYLIVVRREAILTDLANFAAWCF